MKDYAMWYFVAGLFTMLLGVYRSIKYRIEQDELSVMSMFFFWWVWLLGFIFLKCKNFISNDNK